MHEDGCAVNGLDGDVVQLLHGAGRSVQANVVLGRADLGRAGRNDDVLRIDGVDHIGCGKTMAIKLLGVDIDHDLPHLAAERDRHRGAGHRGQLRSDKIDAEIVQLLFG